MSPLEELLDVAVKRVEANWAGRYASRSTWSTDENLREDLRIAAEVFISHGRRLAARDIVDQVNLATASKMHKWHRGSGPAMTAYDCAVIAETGDL